jgi:hypothetical protein
MTFEQQEQRLHQSECISIGLEAGLVEGANRERERIIKLLEEAECQGEDDWCNTIEQAIALIKGENK